MMSRLFRVVFMQFPFLISLRDHSNHTLFGNLALLRFIGAKKLNALVGLSDFDAPWHDYADIYAQHDQNAFNNVVYKQFEPCMTVQGYKVLLIQKIQLKIKFEGVRCVLATGFEISDKEIISTIRLIEKNSPLGERKPLIVSNEVYLKEQFPKFTFNQREVEFIYYVLRGYSSKIIARYYECSPKTVEARLDRLKLKFDCTSKQDFLEKLTHLGFRAMIPESIIKKRLGNLNCLNVNY